MGIIGKLFSAVGALVAALHGLADTINAANDELRHRLALEAPPLAASEGNGHVEGDRPALVAVGKARKGKGES